MSDELAESGPGRSAAALFRYLLGLLVGIVVLVLLFGKRADLVAAGHQLRHVRFGWVAAALAAEGMSLATFGLLQHRVLRLAGARLPLASLLALSLANDAIANTVPGEPAVSSAYRYRYYRRHGATAAAAGWTIFTMLLALAIGMSMLLLAGAVVALLASTNAGTAGAAAAGLVIVAAAGAVLARRDPMLRLIAWLVRVSRRAARRPPEGLAGRAEATLARMREIPLRTSAAASVVVLATVFWACDFLCLLCSFGAVHAAVPWAGVLLAYGAAQVAGSLPIVPGGFGIIEGSLAVILVGYGAGRVSAISATLAYRFVSFWLVIAAGWLAVALISRVRHSKVSAMHSSLQPAGEPVTAADVRDAVALTLTAFRSATDSDWHRHAGTLDWDCWETVEHMSDDLFAYAAQLGPREPALASPVPFRCEPRRPGGPALAISADPDAGTDGLLQVLEATGAMLAAMVAASPGDPSASPQPFGVPDPDRFAAAVGVAEVLIHGHDVCAGLGVEFQPPDGLCRRVLGRLFPDAPLNADPWRTLRWATGRAELPGYPRVTSWRWDTGRG